METAEIQKIVETHRDYFYTGDTLSYEFRKSALIKLKKALLQRKEDIYAAFIKDFNKSRFDVMTTEFGITIQEIDYLLKHLKSLMKPRRAKTALFNFPSKGKIYKDPYGVVLIIAPWNYPLQLLIAPLAGAIAGGNTASLKPSSYTPNVSGVLKEILDAAFEERYISTILGGRQEIGALLDQKFDYIFFTGSPAVGHLVMEKASVNLTPVSLELGGKSPTIVDKDADIDIAAKRITWGKYMNAGQTCVAPDYIICHESIKDKFVKKVIENIKANYYEGDVISSSFPYVISEKHLNRIASLIDQEKVVFGGKIKDRLIEPTVMDNITYEDKVMGEEIFGPIMPILTFSDLDKLIEEQMRLPKPLALYYFGKNKDRANKVLARISSGGACVNEVIMHMTNDDMPFGGVGNSGMGSYHGEKSFTTFVHEKSVLIKGKAEINFKYPKVTKAKERLAESILKVK